MKNLLFRNLYLGNWDLFRSIRSIRIIRNFIHMSEINLEQKNRTKTKIKVWKRMKAFFANPKKRLIFVISVCVLIILLFVLGVLLLTRKEKPAQTDQTTTEQVADVIDESKAYQAVLDGVMTDKASAEKHPVAIMVENHPDSRPQSGLDQASLIYEAIAEGGITRFLAVYGENEAEKVGPVRSARTYYVDWAHGLDAFFAHVGGNYDALEKIPQDKIYDLDQFRYSSPYWREKSARLSLEHTMYTSTIKLREQAQKNNYPTANNFNTYKYKDDPKKEDLISPTSSTINVNFSSSEYNVSFKYDSETNSYIRSIAGKEHKDKVTNKTLNPKNIVVMTVKRSPTITKINEPGYNMTTIGTGDAKIFLDGKEINGTWKKSSAGDREIFYDEKGQEVVLNRGQLWICVVPPESTVTTK